MSIATLWIIAQNRKQPDVHLQVIEKQIVVYLSNEMLLSNKIKQNIDTDNNMDEIQKSLCCVKDQFPSK